MKESMTHPTTSTSNTTTASPQFC